MATEEQLKAWHEALRPLAVRQLGRLLWPGVAEHEADNVLSRVLMYWDTHPEEVPVDDGGCCAYVRRACVNWTISYKRKKNNQMVSLDALGERDGAARADVVERVVYEGHAMLTGEPPRDERAMLSGEESRYARLLRAELDGLARLEAWRSRSANDLRYWLIWLLDLRMSVAESVHEDTQALEVEAFVQLIAQRVIWHPQEEREHISAARPQLGAVWGEVVPTLHKQGKISNQEIGEAFGKLDCVLEHNTYEKWRQRMHERFERACEELGVPRGVMMRRLLGLLRPKEV